MVKMMLTWWAPPVAPRADEILAPQSTHLILRGISALIPVSGLAWGARSAPRQFPREPVHRIQLRQDTEAAKCPGTDAPVRRRRRIPAQNKRIERPGVEGVDETECGKHTWEHRGPIARSSRSQITPPPTQQPRNPLDPPSRSSKPSSGGSLQKPLPALARRGLSLKKFAARHLVAASEGDEEAAPTA